VIFGRQPAYWIGLIVTIVLGAVSTIAGEGLISDALRGQIENAVQAVAQLLVLVAPLIASALIQPRVTPIASPKLKAGTEVAVEDSDDSVIIQPTPPGPTGVEDGADAVGVQG
jgi:hypothetical protein